MAGADGGDLIRVELTVERPVAAEQAWAEAIDPDGINAELRPWLRMTMPARLRGRELDEVPVGTPLGRSWILLFGFLPADFDDLCLAELEPPRRFLERSQTLSFSTWEHERVIEPAAGGEGSALTDRLGFELRPPLRRIPGAGRLARRVVAAIFTHRHRRLRMRDTAAQ